MAKPSTTSTRHGRTQKAHLPSEVFVLHLYIGQFPGDHEDMNTICNSLALHAGATLIQFRSQPVPPRSPT
jgi:hypothetical protein